MLFSNRLKKSYAASALPKNCPLFTEILSVMTQTVSWTRSHVLALACAGDAVGGTHHHLRASAPGELPGPGAELMGGTTSVPLPGSP